MTARISTAIDLSSSDGERLRFTLAAQDGKPMVASASLQVWNGDQLTDEVVNLRFRGLRTTAVLEHIFDPGILENASRITANIIFHDDHVQVFEIRTERDLT